MSERRQIEGRNENQRYANSPTRGLTEKYLRDNQRTKVYRAEGAALGGVGRPGWGNLTYDEMVEVVRRVQDTEWFQMSRRRDPTEFTSATGASYAEINSGLTEEAAANWDVTVGDGRRRRTGCAIPSLWEIRIPKDYRRLEVVIHELAHLIDQVWETEPHGPQWVHIYLMGLCAIGLQERASRLAAAFQAGGVRGAKPGNFYREQEAEIDLTEFDAEDSQARDRGSVLTSNIFREEAQSALARVQIG